MITLQNFIHRSKRPTYNTSKFKSRGDSGVLVSSLALCGINEVYFFVTMKQLKIARAIFVWPWNDFENARTKQKKQMNWNTAIWLVYRTDTNALGFWLRGFWLANARVKKVHARELSRSQSILPFDVILQHDWPIEQCLLYISWRENEESMFWSFHPLADKTNNEHLRKPLFQDYRTIALSISV